VPVACSTSALTGQDGSLYYTPSATKFCLLDFTDFPAGTSITVPAQHDFRVGDPVVFEEEDGGSIDTALTAGTQYFVVATTATTISVSATKGGTAITLNGDGGGGAPGGGVVSAIDTSSLPTSGTTYTAATGAATETNGSGTGLTVDVTVTSDNVTAVAINAGGTRYVNGETITIKGSTIGATDGTDDLTFTITTATALSGGNTAGGHIGIKYDPFGAVCQIQSWDLSIERESLDVTTLPCGVGESATAGKYAAFRRTQPGYASGSGTITVIFTDNDDALGQRMLDNVMLSSQEGARVRLFVNTVSDGASTPAPDLTDSMYIEADISLESMSISVNPDDPITAEIGYSISNVAHLFKTSLN
jgi:hypothetical protein